jgi:hypothetical protein
LLKYEYSLLHIRFLTWPLARKSDYIHLLILLKSLLSWHLFLLHFGSLLRLSDPLLLPNAPSALDYIAQLRVPCNNYFFLGCRARGTQAMSHLLLCIVSETWCWFDRLCKMTDICISTFHIFIYDHVLDGGLNLDYFMYPRTFLRSVLVICRCWVNVGMLQNRFINKVRILGHVVLIILIPLLFIESLFQLRYQFLVLLFESAHLRLGNLLLFFRFLLGSQRLRWLRVLKLTYHLDIRVGDWLSCIFLEGWSIWPLIFSCNSTLSMLHWRGKVSWYLMTVRSAEINLGSSTTALMVQNDVW